MIVGLLITLMMGLFNGFFTSSPWTSLDLHVDQNNYLLMVLAYLAQSNSFFPVFDGFIPVFLAYCTLWTGLTVLKIVEILINCIPGISVKFE